MKIGNCLSLLKHPDSDSEPDFNIKDGCLVDKNSDKTYPMINNMVDFLGIDVSGEDSSVNQNGIMFKINTHFSRKLDYKILTSVFAAGGIGFSNAKRKIRQWIDQVARDTTLFMQPEDKSLVSYIGPDSCLTIDDLTNRNVLPVETDYPNLNASLEQLPIQASSIQNLVSYFVVEHGKHPRHHFMEIERILEPGGYVILGGPGDVCPSHRIPYDYFNITRYGYYEMFKENNLELIEEYYPSKSWVSILYLCYSTIVRNSFYNRNQFTKLLQMIIFGVSLVISPLMNLIALLMDRIMPFDQRIYSSYMALLRKPKQ